jgi:hypothetical protein
LYCKINQGVPVTMIRVRDELHQVLDLASGFLARKTPQREARMGRLAE